MYGCLQSSILSMNANIYHQLNEQDEVTNEIKRRWVFFKNIVCSVNTIKETGASVTTDTKSFDKDYVEELEAKMYTSEKLSKRWRISDIKNSSGIEIYNEIDRVSNPPTIFEVYSSHPVMDMFGNIQYYENHIKRVSVQKNDSSTSIQGF